MKRLTFLFFSLSIISSILSGSVVHAQSNSDCLACHSDRALTMERGGKPVSIYLDGKSFAASAHNGLGCTDCHAGFSAENIPHKAKITPVRCSSCHDDAGEKHKFHPQLVKALAENKTPDITCSDCHGTHSVSSLKEDDKKDQEKKVAKMCNGCHANVVEVFEKSAHGMAYRANAPGAPGCLTCHRHEISNSAGIVDSLLFKTQQEKVCLSCHLDNQDVKAQTSPTAGFIAAYEKSVHGSALLKGNSKAANCVNCHGSHEMRKGQDPAAMVSKNHIAETCSKCHENIANDYWKSIHGTALARGVKDAPACTDCHGEHDILAHTDPESKVAAGNVSAHVCSPCHSSVKLSQKYGLNSDRFQTFSDSYHGLASKAGSVEVANCASCHGVHNIKPSTDPSSTISKANLISTCGKCHPGANDRFTIGSVHIDAKNKDEPILYWISSSYILLIVALIGGMFAHNLLDFIKKSRRKLLIRRGMIVEEHTGHRLYLRMSFNERIQHASLLVSFITLVITGFALKYPDAWWVAPVRDISPLMFDIRGIVHRVAGVVMILASVYHLYYILFDPRGKKLIRDLLPKINDIYDAIGVLKYNLGFSRIKPFFGRFSYIEKSEYWALVWGTFVMALTGLILWFDNTFLGILTKLGWDAARMIHYYEAWLATLAIIVWHFYFVIFNPDVYPINLAFWKGTLTEEEMLDEHPLELDEIKNQEILVELESEKEKDTHKE